MVTVSRAFVFLEIRQIDIAYFIVLGVSDYGRWTEGSLCHSLGLDEPFPSSHIPSGASRGH